MATAPDRMTFSLFSRTAMISTGLLLLAFSATHLLNLSAGLISIDAMDRIMPFTSGIWLSSPFDYLLYLSLVVHFTLALRLIYLRNTLFSNAYDTIQMVAGAAIVPLMAWHVFGVMASHELMPSVNYRLLIQLDWINSPTLGLVKTALVVALWAHGAIGLLTWLRTKTWGAHALGWVYPVIVAIPVLALLGFVEAGREIMIELDPNRDRVEAIENGQSYQPPADSAEVSPRQPPPVPDFPAWDSVLESGLTVGERIALMNRQIWWAQYGSLAVLFLVLLARSVRLYRLRTGPLIVRYADGLELNVHAGPNLLDIARRNDVPHANLCRGRGRCGTCMVRILSEDMGLEEPSPLERKTLARLGADPDVRLACQLAPVSGSIELERLVSPDFSLRGAYQYDDETPYDETGSCSDAEGLA